MDSALLRGLDEDQQRAVTSPAQPLAVIAPAGSGKTRVLTTRLAHRIATGDADPAHCLCVTFTRRAADELRDRLRAVGVRDHIEAGTFHAVAWRQLRDRWAAQGRTAPRLLDRVRPFLRSELDLGRGDVAEVANEITWARARLVRPDAYPEAARGAGRRTRRDAGWIGEQFAGYEQAKSRRHVVDFDDLLAACAAAMTNDPGFASAQRWRFRHLFVDEFQDVNPLQFQLLEAWRGQRWDVFVVGDPHQSIYGWNGSEPTLLTDLSTRWPALETITLDRTHRSTPEITAAAAAVVHAASLPERHPTTAGPPGAAPRCLVHDDEVAEIRTIAAAIRRRRDPNLPWRAFAVLARTQDQVNDLERGLAALGVPTMVRRQAALLDAPGVRRVLKRLRDDDRPLLTALGAATEPESDDPDVEALADAAEAQRILDPAITGSTFVGWAYGNLSESGGASRDAVTVSTIHSAKGLEWPVVHVAGCEDGWIPLASARRRREREEEARLLYVACTRAGRELTVHWARTRTLNGRLRQRVRSPFLDGFENATAPVEDAATSDAPRTSLAGVRRLLGRAPDPDPVREALHTWRTDRARATRVEPDSILPIEALEAIAARRPRDAAALESVPGLGPARRRRYGPELLAVVDAAVP